MARSFNSELLSFWMKNGLIAIFATMASKEAE
jgi:hypothetical protein